MPEFILNDDTRAGHPYAALNDFAKGYVEAMFFTNGDTGDDRENLLNDWGVECLTIDAVADIAKDCAAFWDANAPDLENAEALVPGSEWLRHAKDHLDARRLGHLFWYARQGHGVGFTDDGNAECLKRLQDAARKFGNAYVEAYRKKIHHR